jgi:triacylglycerol lipase
VVFLPLLLDILFSNGLEKIEQGIKMIKVPTLLLTGENDKVVPSKSTVNYLQSFIKKDLIAKTVINTAHNPYRDNPEQYKKFIFDFLSEFNK